MSDHRPDTSAKLRNIGLLAHVDAGKTTTTEQLLFLTGRIRSLGRVDEGTAQTDWLDVERQRGISVRAASTALEWEGIRINLIDTPGHVDFSGEVERVLQVLDAAILVVSGAEGVQAHTVELWRALCDVGIPVIIFVNKMDRLGADAERVLADIRGSLTPQAMPVQVPLGVEDGFSGVLGLIPSSGDIAPQGSRFRLWREGMIEALAASNDRLLERYLEDGADSLDEGELMRALSSVIVRRDIFPVFFGAAKNGIGIRELLDAIVHLLPGPSADPAGPLSGIIFKVERDESVCKLAYVRLYNGSMQVRDSVENHTRGVREKAAIIRRMFVRKHEDLQSFTAGDIAAVVGLTQGRIGDILGDPSFVPKGTKLCTPLLSVRVEPLDPKDYAKLAEALYELDDEDPLLSFKWVKETRELTVSVMGAIQIEILREILGSRFGIPVRTEPPTVIYKETPVKSAHGFAAYTMPKPCWAILSFLIEPGPPGSGLIYGENRIRAERLAPHYRNEVALRVPEALEQGNSGWEVTDLRITLLDGEHHIFHTHPLDFAVATPMAMMDGFRNAGTKLLEPILRFRITVPEEYGGRVMSDISRMRGSFDPPDTGMGRMVITGEVPLASSMDYPTALASLTRGLGSMSTSFSRYREAPPGTVSERPRLGVHPLDTAKYILWARNALGDRGKA